MSRPARSQLRDPSPEQVAAIVAAVEVLWPRAPQEAAVAVEPTGWKFSGRWWSKPHPVQRTRPWVSPS
jgi:hypothetical protein